MDSGLKMQKRQVMKDIPLLLAALYWEEMQNNTQLYRMCCVFMLDAFLLSAVFISEVLPYFLLQICVLSGACGWVGG